MTVKTSSGSFAGTDSKITITIYGKHIDSGTQVLKDSPPGKECNKHKFEKGQVDIFHVVCPDLGEIITKIKVEKDNKVLLRPLFCSYPYRRLRFSIFHSLLFWCNTVLL